MLGRGEAMDAASRANPGRLRRRIERLRRTLHEAYLAGEPLTGQRILSLSAEIDRLLNAYARQLPAGDGATGQPSVGGA